jgi:serine/threonine-protein kinase
MEKSTETQALIGTTIGNIQLKETLGEGGMGQVFLGVDKRLKRKVAVKVIHPDHRLDPRARAQFLREARVLSQLEHPNICRLYDFIEDDGAEYLVLELVPGKSLREVIDEGELDRRTKCQLADQITSALVTAHALSVVHRDLKPENIRVTPEGVAKVLDFGLARRDAPDEGVTEISSFARTSESRAQHDLTVMGQAKGTPRYMSPEQARGERVSAASDMYSVGLLFFELFSGKQPYGDTTDIASIRHRASWGDIEAIEGVEPPALAQLIEQLTAIQPQDRPGADIVAERLSWIWKRPKRRLRAILAAAVVASLVAAAVISTIGLAKANDARREAEVSARLAQEAQSLAELRLHETEEVSNFLIGLFEEAAPTTPQARSRTARDILDAGALRLRSELDDQPENRVRLMTVVASIYSHMGLYDACEELLEEALEIVHFRSVRERAAVMAALGNLRLSQRNHPAAVAWYQEVLKATEQDSSVEPILIVRTKIRLAIAQRFLGKYQDAESLMKEALPLLIAERGENHEDVLNARDGLAGLLIATGKLDEAQSMHEQLLEQRRRVLGTNHSAVAASLNNLAYVLRRKGEFNEAERYYREALNLNEQVLGENHPDTLMVITNLMSVLHYQGGRLEELERLAKQVIERRSQSEGGDEWILGNELVRTLGQVLVAREKYSEAEAAIRRGMTILSKSLGSDHQMVATARAWLAIALLGQGEEVAAQAQIDRSLAALQKSENYTRDRWRDIERLVERLEALGAKETAAAYRALLTDEMRPAGM